MRFTFGTATNSRTSSSVLEGWQEAPAPNEKQAQKYGFVASCLGMLFVSILLRGAFVPRGLLPTLLLLLLTVPLHELIHAASTPNWGLSPKTVIGIQKSKGLFMPYVYYDGEQSLWHFLLTGLAPTIFLTVVPLVVIMFLPLSTFYRAGFGFLSFFNVALSGGDLVIFVWFATHLHLRSAVRQKGWKLYWKAEI